MVHLERINGGNIWQILDLSIDDSQKRFIPDNRTSIIEAYAAVTGGAHAFPFGIYDGDTPVGFVLIGHGKDDYWKDPPAVAGDNYNIWRFMIDKRYQHKGYGRAALQLAIDFIRTYPCGKAEICWLTYHPKNHAAEKLYSSFGFEPNGEKDAEEIIAVLDL